MAYGLARLSYEKKKFYSLWKEVGFNPKYRNDCLSRAGYAASTIRTRGKKIQREIHEIVSGEMDRQGMTLTKLVSVHKEQLEANLPERHILTKDGTQVPLPSSPDNHARLKALDMAYEIKDAYPSKKLEINQRKDIAIRITMESLKAAEEATGEKIIDLIPGEDWEPEDDKKEGEEISGEREPCNLLE